MQPTPLNDDAHFRPDADPQSYAAADPAAFVAETAPFRQDVTFDGQGDWIAGHLYRPDGPGAFPAVVLIGPETYVKEQAPAAYAKRLRERGYAALVFDPRGRGSSEGTPRDLESPLRKIEDLRAAADFLLSQPEIDTDRLFAVGICQGSSEIVRAVADDTRFRALATLAGHYRDADGDAEWFGGADTLAERRKVAEAARTKYECDGVVDYVKAIDKEDSAVGMPGELPWTWYRNWADAGLWPDRFAVMSDAELLAYESMSASERVRVPTLVFHSDQCMLPDAARRHYEKLPTAEKRLHWWDDIAHFQFYDDARVIDPAVSRIDEWFRAYA